jgi:transposase
MQDKTPQKSRRKYDASFKADVVNMIAGGRSVPDISRSLGIGENIIYRWRREAIGGAAAATQTQTPLPAQVSLAEHLALQKRLRELEIERDILKKPWASSAGHNSGALCLYQRTKAALSGKATLQSYAGQPQCVLSVPRTHAAKSSEPAARKGSGGGF